LTARVARVFVPMAAATVVVAVAFGHERASAVVLQAVLLVAGVLIVVTLTSRHSARLAQVRDGLSKVASGDLEAEIPKMDGELAELAGSAATVVELLREAVGMLRHGSQVLVAGARDLESVSKT